MKKAAAVIVLMAFAMLNSMGVAAAPAIATNPIDKQSHAAILVKYIRVAINDAMDTDRNIGSYRLFKTGTALKSIMDTWQNANPAIGEKTYGALEAAQQSFIADAYAAAKQLNQDTATQIDAAAMIEHLAEQSSADAAIFQGNPALFSYAPRIVHPGMNGVLSFTIQGLNFRKAKPRIILPNGKAAFRVSLSNHEAVFSVPSAIFKFDQLKPGFATLRLSYLNSKKKRASTDISVLQLPQKFSDFTLQVKTQDTVRDTWEGNRQFYWAGQEQSKTLSQGPHDNGWKIVTASLRQGKVWGEAGKGCSVAANSESGFAIEIRHDAVKTDSSPGTSPYQYCEWHWNEYFDRQVITDQPPVVGQLNWLENVMLPLPQNTASTLLVMKTWDGIERTITGSRTEPFFQVVDTGNVLEIKPKIPDDLNAL